MCEHSYGTWLHHVSFDRSGVAKTMKVQSYNLFEYVISASEYAMLAVAHYCPPGAHWLTDHQGLRKPKHRNSPSRIA
jgi:hypothetical protein